MTTAPLPVLMLVPTGIGCEIGGFAGDALPSARLLAAASGCLITHPNVMNGAALYWSDPRLHYVEGYALERSLTSVANPVRVATLEPGAPLRTLPSSDAPVVKTLDEPRNAVNGIRGGFTLVLEDDGTEGWVAVQQQDS